MSGFVMIRREEFRDCIYDQSQQGYKILLDIVASATALCASWNCPTGFATGGRWRARSGLQILVEYGILLVEKLSNEPPSTAGSCYLARPAGLGLGIHPGTLDLMKQLAGLDLSKRRESPL